MELSRCHHALAAHPQSLRFATVGADGSVRLWALPRRRASVRRLVCWGQTPLPCAAVAFAPDGKTIVAAAARAPRLYILDATSLRLLHSSSLARASDSGGETGGDAAAGGSGAAPPSAGGALVVRFSPSGALLAVGAIDGHVYLFDAAQGFLALGVLGGGGDGAHAAAVTALDWAAAPALRLRSLRRRPVRVWDVAARKLDDGGGDEEAAGQRERDARRRRRRRQRRGRRRGAER